MISAHGNKSLAIIGICLSIVVFLTGGIIAERRTKLRLYEKKYAEALLSLEKNNIEVQKNSGEAEGIYNFADDSLNFGE